MRLSSHEIAWLVLNAGFNENIDAPTMTAIILATSGGDTDFLELEKSDDGHDQLHGLTAIRSRKHEDQLRNGNWRNPEDNLAMAYRLFKNFGNSFTHWEAYTTNAYKEFLTVAYLGVENPVKPQVNVAKELEKNSEQIGHIEDNVAILSRNSGTTETVLTEMRTVLKTLTKLIQEVREKFSA